MEFALPSSPPRPSTLSGAVLMCVPARPVARFFRLVVTASFCLALAAVGSSPVHAADSPHPGKAIYDKLCLRCHGAEGEGVQDAYDKPLIGDRSPGDLARLIEETMPEDAPETCVGNDARLVAEFIHQEFYSPAAQARRQPVRVELSRLTARQQQHSLADLIGAFRGAPAEATFIPVAEADHGLEAEYFDAPRFRREKRVLERRDAQVEFQFGDASPDPEKIKAEEFSIRWQGGLLAPVSGEYELIVATENGARLWLNDSSAPLIDAWVRSGPQNEHRQSIRLLAGRWYPLRLEYFKSKEPGASVALKWRLPGREDEVVPARCLSPRRPPESFVLSTPFPPDDRSMGFERGASVSKEWDLAATQAAIETTSYVIAHLEELSGAPAEAPDRPGRLAEFCRRLASLAFRRPLSPAEAEFFVDRHFQDVYGDSDQAEPPAPENIAQRNERCERSVKRSLLLVLKSPRFLYREADGADDSFARAERLSFCLWDSLPDAQLLGAAERGELATPEQLAAQARRMTDDQRARGKLREFFHQWLRVDRLGDLAKDSQLYPDFTPQVVSDLRTSLDLFLDETAWGENSDFRNLLLADWWYSSARLASIYGGEAPQGAGFEKRKAPQDQPGGILSHPLLLSGFAYHGASSPIHRGVFVARSLLGRTLRAPPEAVAPLAPDLHPDLTTRQRVLLQTSPAACQTCHDMINPLGFPLEHYDAIGRFRSEEKGQPIDASGSYITHEGQQVSFQGPRDLAQFLASSEECRTAIVQQVFHHFVKQPIRAHGADQPAKLTRTFAERNYSLRELLVETAVLAAQGPP